MRSTASQRRARAFLALGSLLALVATGFLSCRSRAALQPEARWRMPKAGAVASEHPLATEVGLAILDRGGNAADAAVATALALSVVYPQAGNLGGGGFALWVPHVGDARAFDFREKAPAAADAILYLGHDGKPVASRSVRGPLAVGVPGSPRGLHELWRACGSRKLRFDELVAPALHLAREGFTVDAWLARDLAVEETRAKMNAFAQQVFYPGDRPLREGERLRQPDLANTLEQLALEGADAMYKGRVAEAIVAELAASPIPLDSSAGANEASEGRPWMTLADLSNYEVRERAPLHGWFRGMEIVTMPPPSSGGIALLQALGVLEGMPLDAQKHRAGVARAIERGKGEPEGVDSPFFDERMAHWWIEAARRAFADRAEHMGDPDFFPVPTRELLAPEWIARRRVSIGANAAPAVPAWQPAREGTQTTHLSVLDAAGNAVSLTTTLNSLFGSGILVRGAGFFLNDEMDDFALQAGIPNQFGLVGGAADVERVRRKQRLFL
jgi:gamma-glutamyltranspeptidase/glutathione hydrolase